jgi:hydroxyacid-oxoacid transhydrogenase
MDMKNLGAKRVMLVTDGTVRKLDAVKNAVAALEREGVQYEVFDGVKVEPKDSSVKAAIEVGKRYKPDAWLAVGGGSVIDTAKLMNLYGCFPGMWVSFVLGLGVGGECGRIILTLLEPHLPL